MADKQSLQADALKEDPDKLAEDEKRAEDQPQNEEEAPRATFTKSDDDSGLDDEAKSPEEDEDKESASESTLNDLAEESSTDSDLAEESETPQQDIPPLNSASSSDSTLDKDASSTYFQRNFTKGVNQTIIPNRNRSSKLQLVVLLLLGLAVIGGTVYLLKSQFQGSLPSPSPAIETPQITPSPTPTPQAVDRAKFKVRVLNGTSQAGLAASVSAKLKDLGYQTDKVGNATNSAFERTVVRIKGDVTGLLEQLIRDLTPDYDATSSVPLKDSDSVDAEVILGKK